MSPFEWVAVALVTIVGSARITRLLTIDKFPPIRWVRDKYEEWTDGNDWQLIAFCAYCMSYWPTLAVILTGYHWHWHPIWWIVVGSFAASYPAAILVVLDPDPENEN